MYQPGLKRIFKELNTFGFKNFFSIKKAEYLHKQKCKKANVFYPKHFTNINIINNTAKNSDAKFNHSTAWKVIASSFEAVPLKPTDITLLDIGCGYGKALNYGILNKFKHVVGIDLDEDAITIANDNCRKMQQYNSSTTYEIVNNDACIYKIPTETNVVFLANPFGKSTMQEVLGNIIKFANQECKNVYVIYAVPVFKSIFENSIYCERVYEKYYGDKVLPTFIVYKICPKSLFTNVIKISSMALKNKPD